jgi:hypothetical protein
MLSLQTARVFNSENNFKLACLWCWSPASDEKVNLSWFLSAGSEFGQFNSVSDIGCAMSEVQSFLCVTFGSIWNRCTLCLQEAIRDSHNLRVFIRRDLFKVQVGGGNGVIWIAFKKSSRNFC